MPVEKVRCLYVLVFFAYFLHTARMKRVIPFLLALMLIGCTSSHFQKALSGDALNLSFCGDIMAHTPNFKMKNYDAIYEHVRSFLLQDDLSFGNLEMPVCDDLAMSNYPRFNVHEVVATGSGQGGLRTVNSFVREYLAYEITNNVEYRTRVLGKPKVGDMVQKKEFFLDQKIRETLVNGFREKLGVTIQK